MLNFLDTEKLEKGIEFYNHDQVIEINSVIRQKVMLFKEIAKKNKEIIAGMTVNFNLDKELELEKLGFEIEKTDNVCEGLTFFGFASENYFEIYGKLGDLLYDYMRKNNKDIMYATSSKKTLKIYVNPINGFELIDSRIIDGEKEYLVKKEINKNLT